MRGDNKSRIEVNKSNITHIYNTTAHKFGSSQNMCKDTTRKYTTKSVAILKQHTVDEIAVMQLAGDNT